jgi:uncharacterized membrane protein
MGDQGRLVATVLILASIVIMVVGYRSADTVLLWNPPFWLWHLNNLLMVLALYFYAASGMKTAITRRVRHPQLTGFKTWAVAHLLVNGDLASIVLFGGLLAWAVVEVIVINRAQPDWTRPAPAPMGKETGAVAGAVVATLVIGVVHGWLGPWPFPG